MECCMHIWSPLLRLGMWMDLGQIINPSLQQGTIGLHAFNTRAVPTEDVHGLEECHRVEEDLALTRGRALRPEKGDERDWEVDSCQSTPFIRLDCPLHSFAVPLRHCVDPSGNHTIFDYGLNMVDNIHRDVTGRIQRQARLLIALQTMSSKEIKSCQVLTHLINASVYCNLVFRGTLTFLR